MIELIFKMRKNIIYLAQKSAKDVDDPIKVGYSLISLLDVIKKYKTSQPSLKISEPIIVGTK